MSEPSFPNECCDRRDVCVCIDTANDHKGWLPIGTAPEEPIDVHVYCSDTGEQFVAFRDGQDRALWTFATTHTGRRLQCEPSHWRPLPAPPSSPTPRGQS